MVIYNVMYIFLWGMAVLSYSKDVRINKIFSVQVLILLLFTALRFQTGYDWPVYQSYYNSPESSAISFEIGFVTLVYLFNFLGLNFNAFVFFVSVVQVILIAKVVKYFFSETMCTNFSNNVLIG